MPEDGPNDAVPPTPSSDKTAMFINGLFRKDLKICRKQHDEFKKYDKFVDGEQWDPEDEAKLKAEKRPTGVFNFVKRHVNVVSGVEILNRLGPQFLPRVLDNEDAARLAELDTGCYDYVMENCNGTFEISQAFRDTVVRGMGFLKARLDQTSEAEDKIVWEKVDGLHMTWDCDAMGKENLDGARRFIYFSRVPTKEAAEEWPEHEGYIKSGAPSDFDDQFGVSAKIDQVVPPPYDPQNKYETDAIDSSGKDHVIIKEGYWYVDEQYMDYVDPFDQSEKPAIKHMKKADFAKFKREYAAMYPEEPEVQGAPRTMRVWKRAFVIGGKTMEETDSPVQTGCPIKCITGEWAPNKQLYRGLPPLLKDPQQFLNKYVSQTQHSVATSPKGVLLFEDGAFENYAMAEEQWASWAPFIPMKQGALSGQGKKFEYIPPTSPPPMLMEMWQSAIKVIEQIAGINLEMLGGGQGDVPGITMRQRQSVAMIAMAGFFNSYRRFLKAVAITTLELVGEFYTDDRVIHIGGQYDGQNVMLLKEDMRMLPLVTIDENPRNPNNQDAQYQAIAPMLPGLFKSGAIMQVPSLIDCFPMSPKPKAELKKYIMALGQQIAQGGDTPGQKDQKGGQKGKGGARDDPRMVEAGIQVKQAKAHETIQRAKMLDAETKLKQIKALTTMYDAQREHQHATDAHQLAMWSGLSDQHMAHGQHARDSQKHHAEMDKLIAATEAIRNKPQGASA